MVLKEIQAGMALAERAVDTARRFAGNLSLKAVRFERMAHGCILDVQVTNDYRKDAEIQAVRVVQSARHRFLGRLPLWLRMGERLILQFKYMPASDFTVTVDWRAVEDIRPPGRHRVHQLSTAQWSPSLHLNHRQLMAIGRLRS